MINIANNVSPSVKLHTYFKVKFFIVRRKFSGALVFACFQFVLCSSSNSCTNILAQISSRFYQVHSFTVFPPSKVDFFRLKFGKNMTLTATKIKMLYQNQLPNQLPPESNFIKKESEAHNRVRTKVEKQKTLFTNGGGGNQHNQWLPKLNLLAMEHMPKVMSVNLDHTALITM